MEQAHHADQVGQPYGRQKRSGKVIHRSSPRRFRDSASPLSPPIYAHSADGLQAGKCSVADLPQHHLSVAPASYPMLGSPRRRYKRPHHHGSRPMRTAFLALMLATADGSANAADAGFHAIALPHRRKGLSPAASIADAVAQSAARAGVALRGAVRRAALAITGGMSGRACDGGAGRVSGYGRHRRQVLA